MTLGEKREEEAERQTDRERDRVGDREKEGGREGGGGQTHRRTDEQRQTEKQTDRRKERHRQTERQTDRRKETDRETETDRHIERETETQSTQLLTLRTAAVSLYRPSCLEHHGNDCVQTASREGECVSALCVLHVLVFQAAGADGQSFKSVAKFDC